MISKIVFLVLPRKSVKFETPENLSPLGKRRHLGGLTERHFVRCCELVAGLCCRSLDASPPDANFFKTVGSAEKC